MFHHTAPYIDSYRRTTYSIFEPGRAVRFVPDRRSAPLDRLLGRGRGRRAAYLSAFNPESRPTSAAANRRAQRRLASFLKGCGYRMLRGVGEAHDSGWREEGLLVFRLTPRRAAWIGRLFRQNAVLVCQVGRSVSIAPIR